MKHWWLSVGLVVAILSLLPFALIARSRERTSPVTRVAIVQDMGHQPKLKAQQYDPLFADQRADRQPVQGTIAQGELNEDSAYVHGMKDGKPVKETPLAVTKERLLRGQERFNIYCAACHGLSGDGKGMIDARATELAESGQAKWTHPASYHEDRLRNMESGAIYNTITNGLRTMPPHVGQISVEDRWNIVMYIRALQRSQNAKLDDVPAEKREDLR
ncbi:MAG TPA: cytochrome c [Planctomycetota bacterium]|jgi:mono/diheme cytochrome c family protein